MNKIVLKPDGSIVYNEKTVEKGVLSFLACEVILDDTFTLRSYFRMIERYFQLAELNSSFPSYMKQYLECPATDCVYDGFKYLEFGKTVEMIGFPGEPRLEIYNSLRGIYGTETFDIRNVSLKNLLDMPLFLGKLKHIVFGDKADILEFDTVFNLFDFIDGILWELSFQGTLMQCELRFGS